MSFFSILLALLLEQVRPLGGHHPVRRATHAWALWMARTFDAGERRQAWVTWTLLVGIPALGVILLQWLLEWSLGWLAVLLWQVAVLYATLGFRQFSLAEQPRFRAGFDFLRLRADVQEVEETLADWWQEFSLADDATREDLVQQARAEQQTRARSPRVRKVPAAGTTGRQAPQPEPKAERPASADTVADGPPRTEDEPGEDAATAPKKRRRRRRKPAEGGGGAASAV